MACVNALGRATPISTSMKTIRALDVIIVCQCPGSGYSYFYGGEKTRCLLLIYCVNALGRATPISTVPFREPHK